MRQQVPKPAQTQLPQASAVAQGNSGFTDLRPETAALTDRINSIQQKKNTDVQSPVVQRKITATKDQIEYPDAEVAFHALRSTFPEANGKHLYSVLLGLNATDQKYHDFRNLKLDISEKLKAPAGPLPELSIEQVMEREDLPGFMNAQDKFQLGLTSMDGLQSAGFEFEFASFKAPHADYTKDEIIPSHQLMGASLKLGDYFNLAWRLESDSFNTLELVTPPFVFPKSGGGNAKRDEIKADINKSLTDITGGLTEDATLAGTAGQLAAQGLGKGWSITGKYINFGVVKNQKSGGAVYDQANISLYPAEIGALLEDRFSKFDTEHSRNVFQNTLPENTARKVRYAFGLVGKGASAAVNQAVAIFARYASNALAIPSMRYRQDNNQRKDTLPTEVKETLGIWVKTDALNLLKPILSEEADAQLFIKALGAAGAGIIDIFRSEGEKMVRSVAEAPVEKGKLADFFDKSAVDKKQALTTAQEALKKFDQEQLMQREKKTKAMMEYVGLMLQEVDAFIKRALAVQTHTEKAPQSTTSEFLNERYGTGEGVRKGTYLKNIPTSAGSMYVTEIRDQ